MTGLYAIDDNDRKVQQNLNFRGMYDALAQAGGEWCQPRIHDSREIVTFANGSSLAFDNANKRKRGTLGTSLGLNIGYYDECGLWEQEDSLLSLIPSMDDTNPNRLYIYAGTAQGFNLFHKIWTKAEKATTAKAIFIGSWLHEWYRIERDDRLGLFEQYWDGTLLPEEEVWVTQVKERYNFDVPVEYVAWARHKLDEEFLDNLQAFYQYYPPLPEYAFQYGASTFFDPEILRQKTIEIQSPTSTYKPAYFRFEFGKNFLETSIKRLEDDARPGTYHLALWEPPRDGEGVFYSIGVDPAYGMTETSDYGCIQLVRCFEDGMEQVGEFAAQGLSSMRLAWAILYIFGAYHRTDGVPNVTWNTEVQGGGAAIINTVEQIQQDIGGFYDRLGTHFDSLRAYAYKRVDSLHPNYTAKHHSQTALTRDQMLHHIKSYFECDKLVLHSLNLIYEMSRMIRGPGGYIESSEGKHDDLLMALGVAVLNYWDPIRYDLEGSGFTLSKWNHERELLLKGVTRDDLVYMRVQDWVKDKRDLAREREQELQDLLQG
jgi:hypothetical protein